MLAHSGRGQKGCVAERDDPRHGCVHYRLLRHAGQVPSASARSLAAHSPRPQCPPPPDDRRQQAGRSPTFSRRSPSSPSRYGRLISGPGDAFGRFKFGRDAFSDWHRPRRDGRRGVRLTSDARRPKSAFRSMRFHGAEPGHNSILATWDGLRPRETTK